MGGERLTTKGRLKRCAKCGRYKPATPEVFSRSRQRKDGLKPYCKECLRVRPEDRVKGRSAHKTEGRVTYKTCTECERWFPCEREYFHFMNGRWAAKCKECSRTRRGTVLRADRNDARMIEGILKKPCTKCEELKPATTEYFLLNREGKLGLHPWCKTCSNEYGNKYRLKTGAVRKHWTKPMEIDGVLHQLCTTCEQWKPAAEEYFLKKSKTRLGLNTICRECDRKKSRDYAEKHSDKMVAKAAKWNKENRERHDLHVRAAVHKRRQAPGSFTADDIDQIFERQRGRCFYCEKEVADGYHVDHFIALARGGTNTADNLVIACATCNRRKGAKDPQVFIKQIRGRAAGSAKGRRG